MNHTVALLLVSALGLGACAPAPIPRDRVTVAVPTVPQGPHPHREHEEYSITILANAFEGLVRQQSDLTIAPCLAKSWETPDERTWVFRLREDVLLHDGRRFEAKHVVAAFERAKFDSRTEYGPAQRIHRIEARNSDTVVFETVDPVYAASSFAIGIAVDPIQSGDLPVGTGPYRLVSLQSRQSTILQAFSEHWEGRPEVDFLEFRASPDPGQRLEWLRKGEADLMPAISLAEASSLETVQSVRVVSSAGLRVIFLGMRCTPGQLGVGVENPFSDARVRKAVACAIDRDALTRVRGASSGAVVNQIFVQESYGYVTGIAPIPHDPDLSRRLLAEAEYPHGLEISLDFPRGKYVDIERTANKIAMDLGEVGIRATPRPTSVESIARGEPSPIWLLGWITTEGVLRTYDLLLHSPAPGLGMFNSMGYHDREMDEILNRARGMSPGDRIPLYATIVEKLMNEMPIVPLYRETDRYALNSDLEFQPRLDRRILGAQLHWK
ncbi:MAG: hypothetical protein GY906_02270 [bacterium]|nr:hypothetical protein [bacterium]